MKKLICIVLILILVLGLSLALAGCNEETKTYTITFIVLGSTGKPYSNGTIYMSFEADKPMGNNFKLLDIKASEYTFYTNKKLTTIWNAVLDKVNCDMTLYATKYDLEG